MIRIATLLALTLLSAAPAMAQRQMPGEGVRVGLIGNLYLAGQVWPHIGAPDDQNVGAGLGGMLGVALVIDDMQFGLGPHFGYNQWTADYSDKPSTTVKSATFSMADAGIEFGLTLRYFIAILGIGTSTMGAYTALDDGSKVRDPDLDKGKFGYNSLGVAFTNKRFILGLVYTSYKGAAKDASRFEIRLAVGR